MVKNSFQFIIEVLFWILLVVFVYQLILKISGHSPTDLTILYSGFSILITYILATTYKLGKFTGHVEEFMKNTKEHFRTLRGDISSLRKDVNEIRK